MIVLISKGYKVTLWAAAIAYILENNFNWRPRTTKYDIIICCKILRKNVDVSEISIELRMEFTDVI